VLCFVFFLFAIVANTTLNTQTKIKQQQKNTTKIIVPWGKKLCNKKKNLNLA
jgi:hypothetical protein